MAGADGKWQSVFVQAANTFGQAAKTLGDSLLFRQWFGGSV